VKGEITKGKLKWLLIAPEGIEIIKSGSKILINTALLIAPEGIEIKEGLSNDKTF